eukprot:gene18171-22981_t
MGLLAMPRLRKWDVALVLCAIGGLIEIIQGFIGRDCDVMDWVADNIGIVLAVAPMSFEAFRLWARGGAVASPKRRQSDRRSGRTLAQVPVQLPVFWGRSDLAMRFPISQASGVHGQK